MVIANKNPSIIPFLDKVMDSLRKHGVTVVGEGVARGSAPNSPREDVYRMAAGILQFEPECIVAVGGGSTIDAVKAPNVLACLGKWDLEIESFLSTRIVTEAMTKYVFGLITIVAVVTPAG